MNPCPWCGTSRRCPDCKAAALRGGDGASGGPSHLIQGPAADEAAPPIPHQGPPTPPPATHPTQGSDPDVAHPIQGPDKAHLEGHTHSTPPSASTYAQGCRHPDCRAINTAYRRERRRARGAQARRHRGLTHGRASTYNQGCRCESCRGAHAAAVRRFRAGRRGKRAENLPSEPPRIPSKPRNDPPMGDDSGQIDG